MRIFFQYNPKTIQYENIAESQKQPKIPEWMTQEPVTQETKIWINPTQERTEPNLTKDSLTTALHALNNTNTPIEKIYICGDGTIPADHSLCQRIAHKTKTKFIVYDALRNLKWTRDYKETRQKEAKNTEPKNHLDHMITTIPDDEKWTYYCFYDHNITHNKIVYREVFQTHTESEFHSIKESILWYGNILAVSPKKNTIPDSTLRRFHEELARDCCTKLWITTGQHTLIKCEHNNTTHKLEIEHYKNVNGRACFTNRVQQSCLI